MSNYKFDYMSILENMVFIKGIQFALREVKEIKQYMDMDVRYPGATEREKEFFVSGFEFAIQWAEEVAKLAAWKNDMDYGYLESTSLRRLVECHSDSPSKP